MLALLVTTLAQTAQLKWQYSWSHFNDFRTLIFNKQDVKTEMEWKTGVCMI